MPGSAVDRHKGFKHRGQRGSSSRIISGAPWPILKISHAGQQYRTGNAGLIRMQCSGQGHDSGLQNI